MCAESENGREEQKDKAIKRAAVQYEYGGYQIRIHFAGEKTLLQCMKHLMEHKI